MKQKNRKTYKDVDQVLKIIRENGYKPVSHKHFNGFFNQHPILVIKATATTNKKEIDHVLSELKQLNHIALSHKIESPLFSKRTILCLKLVKE